MKILKIIVILFLILLAAAGIGFYVFFRNFDANVYKDQIAREIGNALQTTAEIDRISLKFDFRSGTVLDVEGLRLADQGLIAGAEVRVSNFQLKIDAVRFLKTREVVVEHAAVREPVVRLDMIRLKERSSAGEPKVIPQGSRDDQPVKMPRMLIQSVTIEGGRVIIGKDGRNIMRDVEISDLVFRADNLSFGGSSDEPPSGAVNEPFTFQMRCAALGSSNAVSVQGKGWIDLTAGQVRLDDVDAQSSLSAFSLSQIAETFPVFEGLQVRALQGIMRVTVHQIVIGPDGIPVLAAEGALTQAGASLEMIPAVVTDGDIRFEFSGRDVDILESHFKIGAGLVTFKGRIQDIFDAQLYHMDIQVSQAALQELLPRFHQEIFFSGNADGAITLKGSGFDPAQALRNLKADMKFSVADGVLHHFNVLNYIFDRITIIPDLARSLEESLPEEYRKEARTNRTVFDRINATVTVGNGVASYVTRLTADIAEVNASGTIDPEGFLTFQGVFALPPALSSSFVRKVSAFSPLMQDGTKTIVIPLADYRGRVNDFRLMPDTQYLAKTLIVSRAKDEIRNLLGDALGIKRDAGETVDPAAGDSPEESTEATQQGRPERRLLDSILNAVFE